MATDRMVEWEIRCLQTTNPIDRVKGTGAGQKDFLARHLTHSVSSKEQFSPVLFWDFHFFNCTGCKGLKRTQKKIPQKWQ